MKEKLLKFVKENGFLLFLFICVGIVASSTIYVVTKDLKSEGRELLTKDQIEEIPKRLNEKDRRNNTLKSGDRKDIKDSAKKEEPKQEDPKKANLDSNKEKEKSKPQQDLTLVKKEEKKKEEKKEEELVQETFSKTNDEKNIELEEKPKEISGFMMPINGTIITEFTRDTLVYSKTLDEWRTHPGIDIGAKLGEKVKAPLDGTVKDIVEDPLWGKVVLLDHGNGLISKFANLGDTNMIKKGLSVKKGNYIATVGKTADIEMLMEPHLHFELIKDGKLVDPRSIP